ncbi:hypothetical protein E3T61_19015 [Cryobacterium lactosi]|uniref:DUF4352 domain-containing protein n=1 Tax=Cryobacterium lactosi TaxID=1259202 RepID=A0A4R9BHK8_9MICO|nr:hypothetical protein [Cryobacterium lactosi]TFD84548.1 hypothetical protein E3T61_19015 [Cryobacterium lactosi]
MRPADARSAGARGRQRWQGIGVLGVSGVAIALFVASLSLTAGGTSAEAGATAVTRLGSLALSESGAAEPPDPLGPDESASVTAGAEPEALEPFAAESPLVELPSVPLTEQVAPVPGLVFTIGAVRSVDVIDPGEGEGEGVAVAPALRLSVTLRNDTNDTVSLESTAVSLYAGTQLLPMTALPESRGGMLPEWVPAGATVTGLYLFAVPAEDRSSVRVVVDYAVGAPRVVFAGTVPR